MDKEDINGEVGVFGMNNNQVEDVRGYTEGWVPVKQILNGMILTDDGYYISGVKVEPKNIFILERGAQDVTLEGLRNFYNTIDYDFWLIVADRPVDIHLYMSQLQLLYNNNSDPVMRKLITQDINKGNMFVGNDYGVVDTEYYLLIKEKRVDVLQKKIRNMIMGLANAGLTATQPSNTDLRVVLDHFLNDGEKTEFGTVM